MHATLPGHKLDEHRRMRRLLIALILLAMLVLLPLLALRSERLVIALAYWAVDQFTGFRLVLRDPTILPARGILSAGEIHLYPKGSEGPPFISVLDFHGRVDLDDILLANLEDSSLAAHEFIIYVSDRDSAEDPAPIEWLQYLGWLPAQLRIEQVHLITAAENTWIFPLGNVIGDLHGDAGYLLTANAQYEGEPLGLEINLESFREENKLTRLDLRGEFLAPQTGSNVLMEGYIEGTLEDFFYQFQLDANYTQIGEFLKGFERGRELRGTLQIAATMTGDSQRLELSNARVVLDNMPEYGIEAAGSLEQEIGGGSILSLVAAGELASLEYVLNWLQFDSSQLGRAQASATISGSLQRPVIDDFIVRTESDNGLIVNVSGRLEPLDKGQVAADIRNQINFDMQAPSSTVLENWISPLPAELGAWRASGRLQGNRRALQADQLIFEIGNSSTAKLRVEGAIGDIGNLQAQGARALRDLQLRAQLYSPDSSHLGELFGLDLPPYFEVDGEIAVQGDGAAVQADGGTLTIRSSDLDVTVIPTQFLLQPQQQRPLSGLRASVEANLSDTSALSQFSEAAIPALGPVHLKARLAQHGERFQLRDIDANVDGRTFKLRTRGKVNDLATLSGVVLDNRFSGIESRDILLTLLDDFSYSRNLGHLQGSFTIANPGGVWRASDIVVDSHEPGGPLELHAAGEANDLLGFPSADLSARYHLRDPVLLEALLGLRMNPSKGSLAVRSSRGKLDASSDIQIGDTPIVARAEIRHDQETMQGLTLVLDSPHVRLEDVGLQADLKAEQGYRPSEQLEVVEASSGLDRLLSRSPRYPTDITINLENISGDNTNIQALNMHLTGVDNRYTLRRFSLTYDDAQAEVRGIIDLNPRPPAVSLAGEGVGIPLNTLSRDLGMDTEVTGKATVRGGITATGTSSEQLIGTLDGSVAVALEDAVIEGAAYDVLATDLLAWIYSGAAMEESTLIDCTMGSFLLDDGVATSDSLYIETRKMVATGKAMIDLPGEKLDITITPRSKSRALQVPSSVRLRGDFDSPRPTISPISAAADTYAQIITLVPKLALRLFGIQKETKRRQRPCEA